VQWAGRVTSRTSRAAWTPTRGTRLCPGGNPRPRRRPGSTYRATGSRRRWPESRGTPAHRSSGSAASGPPAWRAPAPARHLAVREMAKLAHGLEEPSARLQGASSTRGVTASGPMHVASRTLVAEVPKAGSTPSSTVHRPAAPKGQLFPRLLPKQSPSASSSTVRRGVATSSQLRLCFGTCAPAGSQEQELSGQ
jgi:hypothetical protein